MLVVCGGTSGDFVLGVRVHCQHRRPLRRRLVRMKLLFPLGVAHSAQYCGHRLDTHFQSSFRVRSIPEILKAHLTDSLRGEQSLLGGLFQTVILLSGTIGVCLCSLVQTVATNAGMDLHQALQDGFWMLSGFSWLCESNRTTVGSMG